MRKVAVQGHRVFSRLALRGQSRRVRLGSLLVRSFDQHLGVLRVEGVVLGVAAERLQVWCFFGRAYAVRLFWQGWVVFV